MEDRADRPDLVPGGVLGMEIRSVPIPILGSSPGIRPGNHLDPIRGQNIGLFRFLSTDLTRRPGLGDVGASLE